MTGGTTTAVAGGVLVALLIVAVAGVVLSFNRLVRLRRQADAAWQEIDAQLRRRYDLIPHLVETVRRHAAQERGAFDAVVGAHSAAIAAARNAGIAERSAAEGALTLALSRLVAAAEAYPELRLNPGFVSLQFELDTTEEKISHARHSFNAAVRSYNRAVRRLPTNVLALITGFRSRDAFQSEAVA